MISKLLTKTLLSVVATFAIIGCGSSSDSDTTPKVEESTITPYQRVAVIPGTKADIQTIALKISDYVVNTDEKAVLGFPSNWVIAGANPHANEQYNGNDDLIPIPVDTGTQVNSMVQHFRAR